MSTGAFEPPSRARSRRLALARALALFKREFRALSRITHPNLVGLYELGRDQQQFFFTSCSLQDMLQIHRFDGGKPATFHQRWAVQLNDTHPSVAVAELMRLLVDEHDLGWDEAWAVTRATFAYTNHTLLPEALERWPLELFKRVLPRHLEIIYEINARFLDEVRNKYFGDGDRVARMSLIDESGERYVRMAHLACVGSHAINGVAALHTELLKADVLHDFHDLWPDKFSNKTNGVTPRRWIVLANPRLTKHISGAIGDGWIKDLAGLKELEKYADDAAFRAGWREIKRANKRDLAEVIHKRCKVAVDPASMFDVQVKRIHEYKRQLLNILHVISRYQAIRDNPEGVNGASCVPRTVVIAGKAASAYQMAKSIVRLAHDVARVINSDPRVGDKLAMMVAETVLAREDHAKEVKLYGLGPRLLQRYKDIHAGLFAQVRDGIAQGVRVATGP